MNKLNIIEYLKSIYTNILFEATYIISQVSTWKNIPKFKKLSQKNKRGIQLKCMTNIFNLPQLYI